MSLLKPLLHFEPLWAAMEPALKRLTDFSVAVRYPGSMTDRFAASQAFITCREMRSLARLSLGLRG